MKVLMAIQDGDCVKAIGDFSLKYPWPADCEFKIVHVITSAMVGSYMSILPAPMTESITEERRRHGQEYVNDMVSRLREAAPGAPTSHELVEGNVKMELVDQLKAWKPDLVVMGSHGKHGLETLGSVSRAVVTQSPCSVMVVPIEHHKDKMHIIV